MSMQRRGLRGCVGGVHGTWFQEGGTMRRFHKT